MLFLKNFLLFFNVIHIMSKYLALLLLSLPCLSMAAQPVFYAPLDDSAEVIAPDGSKLKSGIIYGKSGYLQKLS